jgi:hypothetical protein
MLSLITGLLGSSGGMIAMLVVVAGLVGSGAYVMHDVDNAKLEKVELSYKTAEEAAVAAAAAQQKAIDAAALAASSAEAQQQAQFATALQQELSDVQVHVSTKLVPCIPYGLVRVLDAAVLGVSASSLALPAGKSDATCSALTANDLAGSVISNYGSARANAEQLTALQKLLRQFQLTEKK